MAGLVLLSGAVFPGEAAFAVSCLGTAQGVASPEPHSEQRFSPLPDFEFEERSGFMVSREGLMGAPWIAIPFYARCMGPCPSMTADLRAQVYPRLAGSDVRMVSFSVDPKFDTPSVLNEWASRFQVEDDRWMFVTGDATEMETFVRGGLKVALARSNDAEVAIGEAITHGTRLAVIDPEGRIAGWYDCAGDNLTREQLEANMALMANRALALQTSKSILPGVNASLNGLAGILLIAGLIAIKRGQKQRHEALMKSAFLVSVAFLASYLYYHTVALPLQGGPTEFHGAGFWKIAYLVLLGTHVLLAAVNLPMVLRTLLLAHREDWTRHRWWARITFPIWLYVSVTGVLVYFVLYHWNPVP